MGKQYKTCAKCKVEKDIDSFGINNGQKDGIHCWCKDCVNKEGRKRYQKNIEYEHNRRHCYYKTHKEQTYNYTKKYRVENSEKVKQNKRNWRKRNPKKAKTKDRHDNQRRYSTPRGKLRIRMSSYIRKFIKENKRYKHWEDLVGYTVEDLKQHLESQFTDGMTWDNYGKWHIDHKIPLSVFNFDSPEQIDFKRCWALENLQPMWAKENIAKHAKINKHFQPMLKLKIA